MELRVRVCRRRRGGEKEDLKLSVHISIAILVMFDNE
jgi:hypothetical protein